jgi:hypothetical protein
MSLASNMQNVANSLLQKYGEQPYITVSRSAEGAFDPSTGSTGSDTNTSFTGYGQPDLYQSNEIDGQTVLSTDIKFIARTEQEILTGDLITFGGYDYRVISVQQIRVEGQDIAYQCQLRK